MTAEVEQIGHGSSSKCIPLDHHTDWWPRKPATVYTVQRKGATVIEAHGRAAMEAEGRLEPFEFQRRDPRSNDVTLEVLHCGICHSDIHYVNNDWGFTTYPIVPGHEIVGRITHVGR